MTGFPDFRLRDLVKLPFLLAWEFVVEFFRNLFKKKRCKDCKYEKKPCFQDFAPVTKTGLHCTQNKYVRKWMPKGVYKRTKETRRKQQFNLVGETGGLNKET